MAAVTTVLYWNAQGTATARPVFAVLEIEQTDIDTPAKVAAWLADMGYGSDVSLGVLPGDPAEVSADDDTTVNFLTVNPATLATTAAAATNELGERRRAVQSTIDGLIAQATAASAPAQKITLAQWQAWQAYVEALQAARAAVAASSNPEAVALPALALPGGTSTKTVAQQVAALMDDNSISVSKVLLTDRDTLAPEFTFDDNDLGLFTTGLSMGSGWWSLSPSGNLSGGYALIIPATLSSTLLGRPENYFSVTPGDVLVLEAKLQAAAGYDGAVRYAPIFYAQDKATLVSGAASAVNWTPSGSSWQTFRDTAPVPSGAKWATLAITSVPGTTGFARADGLKVKTRLPDDIYLPPAIDAARITGSLPLARLAAIPSGRVLGRAVTDADGTPYGLDGAALKAIIGAIVSGDITSLDAAKLTGTLAAARLGDGTVPLAKLVSGAANRFLRDNGSAWVGQNIVGTVLAAGGALFEQGAGYIEFADGTAVAFGTVAGSASGAVTWTYGITFSAVPVVLGTCQTTTAFRGVTVNSRGVSSADINVFDGANARQANSAFLLAIGRTF